MTNRERQRLLERLAALDECDGYVLVVLDPASSMLEAHGPLPGPAALHDADRRRRDLDARGLPGVVVSVVRYHRPRAGTPDAGHAAAGRAHDAVWG